MNLPTRIKVEFEKLIRGFREDFHTEISLLEQRVRHIENEIASRVSDLKSTVEGDK